MSEKRRGFKKEFKIDAVKLVLSSFLFLGSQIHSQKNLFFIGHVAVGMGTY